MGEPEGQRADVSECAREPIHVPGTIQPHGVLLRLDSDFLIRRSAGDIRALLGWEGDPLDKPAADLLGAPSLNWSSDAPQAAYAGTVIGAGGRALDAFVHRSGAELIVELEASPTVRLTGAEVLGALLPPVSGIAAAADVIAASNIAADAVRRITGYDRVMIYRFLADESGQVIAESRGEDVESFLHHRYPASDIPQQARALYLRNPIRVIPDVGYEPLAISGGDGPLDLSGALLRSVSPVHIQYLKNMGVGASASVSLIRDGALWGLIACHHMSARPIPHEQREMCRGVAIALEQAIDRLEEEDSQREALRLTHRREELLPVIAAADTLSDGLRTHVHELRRLVPADGIALLLDTEAICSGVTPPEAAVRDIARLALEESASDLLVTDELSNVYAPAAAWASSASGLIALTVSRSPMISILWFRAEEVETVNWAGNPHKAVEPGRTAGALTPRRSFELWSETVRGRSRPWRSNEQEAAQRIAANLADIGRHKAMAELNRRLTSEVEEKDLLMREVHHRVQNSLQLVTSLLQHRDLELGDAGARAQMDVARDRVLSVALLHRRLWRSDDLQHIDLGTFLGELVEGLTQTWKEDWRGQVTLAVTPLRLPAHEALLIALIVSELLTNAVKHAYGGGVGPISVSARDIGNGRIEITVADRGVGTSSEARAEGFGSRLIQRLVSNMGGELRVLPNDPGMAVTLVVPIAH